MDVLRPTSTYGSGSGEILRSSRLDNSIRSILGLLDDKKRIYRYHETADEQINQQREEFLLSGHRPYGVWQRRTGRDARTDLEPYP
jgi:hypothetical protein